MTPHYLVALIVAASSISVSANTSRCGELGRAAVSAGPALEQSGPSFSRRRRSSGWAGREYEQLLTADEASLDGLSVASSSLAFAPQWRSERTSGAVQMCSVTQNLIRGALFRIASDLSGGTPLESIKCRVTSTNYGPIEATRSILREGGLLSLWSGTPSRTIEGALMGGIFLVTSAFTKKHVIALTGSQTLGALAAGMVGGVAQSVVMTPAGMVFTSLNVNKGKPGYENDNAYTVARRIIKEKGVMGMFIGFGPMSARQASNWASRSMFTEICRTNLKLSRFGMLGEIGSGIIGGLGSCWNTPIETVRVYMHADVAAGLPPKKFMEYYEEISVDGGYPGLFRGVTPRAVQAMWQTVFMVVVPNVMGL